MNIGDHISSHDGEISRNIDFSTIWPDIPAKGYLYTMAGPPHNQTLGYHYKREYVINFNFDRSHIRYNLFYPQFSNYMQLKMMQTFLTVYTWT